MRIRRYFLIFLSVLLLTVFAIISLDRWVASFGIGRIYYSIDEVPTRKIGLVLGTSKYIGRIVNRFYSYRIEAAKELYQNGNVTVLLLSGDNAHRSYNEPWAMKRDMIKGGVADQHIVLDYAGFRTLDSVVRAKEVFKANEFMLITQAFHCERALFIALNSNIDAICFAVPSPKGSAGLTIRLREILARVKAVLDIYLLDQKPKFLGETQQIIIEPPIMQSPISQKNS
ncbi:MAG: SanA/YdcF family protein [Vibrionaceae bacterium]